MSALTDAVAWEQRRVASRIDDILSHTPDENLTSQLWQLVDDLRAAASEQVLSREDTSTGVTKTATRALV